MSALCETCGKPLAQRDGEKPSHFARRKSCNRTCASGRPKKADHPRWVVEDQGFATPCWVWQRAKTPGGYGQLRVAKRAWVAHRWYWEQKNGPVPDALELDHLCRVRACVNPDHLEPVTHAENGRRGNATILTVEEVLAIRASTDRIATLAERFGVAANTIQGVRSGPNWRVEVGL